MAAGAVVLSPVGPVGAQASSGYQALTPARIVDTRVGLGAQGPVPAGGSIDVTVTGVGGVPASGVGAVVLNVTATNPTDATFVTVWPTGQARPTASNLNVVAGQSVPNLVVATVGAGGQVSLYNYAGNVDLLADVSGWFPAGSGYHGLTPERILDTRSGVGAHGRVPAGGSIDVKVTGQGGVPDSGVGAVVLNVTATNPTDATFVTVWPTGQARPTASNLNVVAGQSVPNLVMATVGSGGEVSLYNYAGTVDLLADVAGWFPAGADYTGLTPARILDTRTGIGAPAIEVGADQHIDVTVTGVGGVPASGVGAVVLNVTATNPTDATFATVWPTGQARPTASNLNVVAGQSVPNLVIATVGSGGKVSLYNYAGTADLIADVIGWFPGITPPPAGITGNLYYPYFDPLRTFAFATGTERSAYSGSDRDIDGHLWQGYGVSWGGREFAYQILRPTVEVPRVHIRDLDTGVLVTGFDVGCGGCREFRAELSPDGQLVAIDTSNTDHPLHIYNREGQLLRSFTGVADTTWAPDGTLVFVGEPIAGRYMMGRFLDVVGSNDFEPIAEYNPANVPFDDLPSWIAMSPDNAEVAYTYLGDLWVQPVDGSPARKVADAPTNHLRGPAFSPDSQHIAFHLHHSGPIHAVPAHPPAPTEVADGGEGPTAVRNGDGFLLYASGQLHWLA